MNIKMISFLCWLARGNQIGLCSCGDLLYSFNVLFLNSKIYTCFTNYKMSIYILFSKGRKNNNNFPALNQANDFAKCLTFSIRLSEHIYFGCIRYSTRWSTSVPHLCCCFSYSCLNLAALKSTVWISQPDAFRRSKTKVDFGDS